MVHTSNDQRYVLSPEWSIDQKDQSLTISGGADAAYEIELEESVISFFGSLKSDHQFTRLDLTKHDLRVLEQLITAEIVVPVLAKASKLRVGIISGADKLILRDSDDFVVVDMDKPYDIALVVRTNSSYADLLAAIEYQSMAKPHLFVDMAFHHTLSIGPLVFPGETACIACLQGRITARWDDETPPKTPKIALRSLALASELVAMELDRVAHDDTSLTNKTVVWNIKDRIVTQNQLLKVPLCPVCTQNTIDDNGALALPWRK